MATKGQKARREKRVVSAKRRMQEHTSGFERTTLKLPDGVQFFQPKEPGTYRLEIIPYKAGKGNKYFAEGEYAFERTFWIHRNVGPENNSYVCPAKTAGKKCPVCNYRANLAKDPNADEDLVKSLAPKERQLFNVYDHKHPDRGVQVWEISTYLFGKHLDNKIKNADPEDRERYEQFANEENGLTLRITASQESMGSNTFLEFGDIEFKERKEELDPAIFDQAVCLDDCIKLLDYDELKKILLQIDDDDAPPAKGKGKTAVADDDDEDEDDDSEDDDSDDDDDDTPPPAKGKGKSKPTVEEDDEDDDDDSDDDDGDDESEAIEVGTMVTGMYKGKTRTGKVKKVTTGKNGKPLYHVQVRGLPDPWIVADGEVEAITEDDDEDDDDDTPPPAKAKGKGKAAPVEDDDEDDDDDDLGLGDDDDEDDDDTPPPAKGKGKASSKELPFDLDDDDDDEPDPTPKDKGKGKRKVK